MTTETFIKVLDRLESQTKIRNLLFYIFSEPLLAGNLAECVKEAHKRGIYTMISTNLSHPKNLEKILGSGLDELRISFSGFENGEYFHKGRDMKQFIRACFDLATYAHKYDTKISLIFHHYKTNEKELPLVRSFAEALGFELIDEPAFFIGWEKIIEGRYEKDDLELISHLKETPEEATSKLRYQDYCYYQRKQLAIDANGKLILCRHVLRNEHFVGDIFKDSLKTIRKNMIGNDFCVKCKEHKLNTFAP
jgi:molybdenum cofactor biosynthesis enzyme MoaA